VIAMKMNYKALSAVLLVLLAFAYFPLLTISAEPDNSTVLSAVTGLSTQIASVQDNLLLKLNSIDAKISTVQTATGANIQSLMPLLQAIIGLVAVTLVLCIVNLYLLFRRTAAPAKKVEEKVEEKPKT
jgi:hypothetical protein